MMKNNEMQYCFENIPRDSSEFTIDHPDIHFVTVPNFLEKSIVIQGVKKWFIFDALQEHIHMAFKPI